MKSGALSVLLLVITICLAVLSVLSFSTAHASRSLAEKQAVQVAGSYTAERSGQVWLAEIDAILEDAGQNASPDDYIAAHIPAGSTFEQAIISTQIEGDDGRRLTVSLALDEGYHYTIASWKNDVLWTPDESLGNLYSGN